MASLDEHLIRVLIMIMIIMMMILSIMMIIVMLLNRRIWIQAKAGQVKLAVGDILGGQPCTRSQPTRIKLIFREAL